MSRNKHIRKVWLIGIVDRINDNEEFSIVLKLQPKWFDDSGEKLGKPIFVDIFFDDQDALKKYKHLCKVGNVLQVSSTLRHYRWQDKDGIKKKKIVVGINKYESSIIPLPIKKSEDMPYLNKVIVLGSCFKSNIKSTQDGRLMGIFPVLTKKSYKNKDTGEIVEQDEWLDIFNFNERSLSNFPLGENSMEYKMIFIEGQLQTSNNNNTNENRNTIVTSKRTDNEFIILSISKNDNNDQNDNSKENNLPDHLMNEDDLPF